MSKVKLSLQDRVSHAADYYRRYPGESVTFFTRVELSEPSRGFTLRVVLPVGLKLEGSLAEDLSTNRLPIVYQDSGETNLVWQVVSSDREDRDFEFQVWGTVGQTLDDINLESRAILTIMDDIEEERTGLVYLEETVVLSIFAKSRYLKYLPGIYQEDELMGRLLMLFESFLDPLDKKIESQADYFDPKLAPKEFLPWLASWTGLPVEPTMDEVAQRRLANKASQLIHARGTRNGLQDYLAALTGGEVNIVEHFSDNFQLGQEAKLGLGIALGTDNIPNTFSVYVKMLDVDYGSDEEANTIRKHALEHKIYSIIEAEKPAHTGYTLHLEYEPIYISDR
jgi:phage tail-like protein